MRSSESIAHLFNNAQIELSDNVRDKDSIRIEVSTVSKSATSAFASST
jgi:hypothetical protein